jgi:hypothetical protein
MVEITAILSAVSAIKSAMDITKAMKDVRDASIIQSKIIELQSVILDAQSSIFDANQERTTLIEKVSQLEKQIAGFEKWQTEKARYELTDIGSGNTAYAVRKEARGSEPPHYICANCYQNDKKSMLNPTKMGAGYAFHCSACNSAFMIKSGYRPPS